MIGFDFERAAAIVEAAKGTKVTFAGGTSGGREGVEQIARLDTMGADVQAGTAIATGELSLAAAFSAPLNSDRPDGLWPTIVCDEGGRFLGLVYSDLESLNAAFESGRGVYKSRSRGLWVKGETSGNGQGSSEPISIATGTASALRSCRKAGDLPSGQTHLLR